MISVDRYVRRNIKRFKTPVPIKGFAPILGKEPKVCQTAHEAVQCIKSHDRVFIHEVVQSPHDLIKALSERRFEFEGVETTGIFPTGIECLEEDTPEHRKAFTGNCQFIGAPSRKSLLRKPPHDCFLPMFLHEVPQHIRSPNFPIDVALMTLSPPNEHGYCSLGGSVTIGKAGAEAAKIIVAEINPNSPFTVGNSFVHYSHLDYIVHTGRQMPQYPLGTSNDTQNKIGAHIAALIPDGACIQTGIGGIPDAVLAQLKNHRHLGVHTEMFAEGLIDLIDAGAIDNSLKVIDRGQVTVSFVMGTDRLYKRISRNPFFHFEPADISNDPHRIAMNPKMVAINERCEG